MHHLLIRQLRRALSAESDEAVEALVSRLQSNDIEFLQTNGAEILAALPLLLNRVSETYEQNDRAVNLRERSLSISTDELTSANARLRAETNIKQDAIETLRRSANGILLALGQPEITDDQAGLGTLSNLMVTLVSQRQAIDEELRQQKRALDHHAIVSITDANGIIIYANEKFCDISGYTSEELIGKPHRIVKSGIHRREFFVELWDTITAGNVWHGEVCNRKKSGELYWVNATIVPILDEHFIPRNYIAIRTDITANKRMAEDLRIAAAELNKAKEAAEAGLQAKSAFLANMSHEIRTPMNAVIGFAEVALQDPALSSETRKHVKMILSSAKELLSIINDILDISKLESAKFTLETACFNLPNVLSGAMRTLEHKAVAKGLSLSLEYATTLPIRLMGDPYRLRQVILNLLGNAVKFTNKGEIVLSVRQGDEPDMLLFSVKDNGIGMTPEHISKIFEPFSQADASTTRHYGGTGLGTTISKQIVELMQGKIWVESEIGKGSVFYFTAFFPEATITEGCLYEEDDSIEENYISPRLFRILLAEDIETNATLAMLRLRQQGHEVDWVKNGVEAVDAVWKKTYDLVLMDVMMPEMDGLEATRTIREMETGSFRRMPILALTASITDEDNENCYTAGMDRIESKPIDFNKLFMAMEQVAPQGAGHPNTIIKINIEARREIDFSPLEGIADYNKALKVWQVAEAYAKALLQFARYQLNDANLMERLLMENPTNCEPARAVAHALKGVAGNLAISRVSDLAAAIDLDLKSRQREEAKAQLGLLHESLQQVGAAIAKLHDPYNCQVAVVKDFDAGTVKQLLLEFSAALDALNPDVAEPVLLLLSEYLAKSDIEPIQLSLESFDFDEAKNGIYALADKLNLSME
jgi:PAS domain S-box-containing protein